MKENYQEIIDTLARFKGEDTGTLRMGICSFMTNSGPTSLSRSLWSQKSYILFKQWPRYSGGKAYPIPSTVSVLSAEGCWDAVYLTKNTLSHVIGERELVKYLELRLELTDWLIVEFEKLRDSCNE